MKQSRFLSGLGAALFLALGLAGPASAQNGDDEGEYQILQARYGTSQRNIDVTSRLKELAREDRRFRITNDTFGEDPHPHHVKTLRIFAKGRDGRTRTFEYPENGWVDGSQFTGWGGGNWGHGGWNGGWGEGGGEQGGSQDGDDAGYQILQARYGTSERNIDVTRRLKELAREDRRFRITNDTFGEDPHPHHVKTLRIYAKGGDGKTRTFEYPENGWVDGSQFSGWSSGNWGHGGWSGGWGEGGGPHGGSQPNDDGDYQILQARYGTSQRNIDVTRRLKELAREDRKFRITNDTFGEDPHPDHVKTLRIYAKGRDGKTRTFEYLENGWVDGSQFSGWSGGNWGHGGWNGGWGETRPRD
jgi:hypothetical protein